ncbi:IS1380 family transposase, partial [Nesterenkonia salmonea]
NTAADHITVIDQAIEALPAHVRPGAERGPGVLVRSDSAGASHAFADHCRELGVEFSFGYFITQPVQKVVDQIPAQLWQAAINTDANVRDGAWVVDATDYVNISSWPTGTRLILRKERPHPGAQ